MAENRILQWILRAKDESSAVLDKAGKNVEGFGSKASTAIKALGAIAATMALGKFFKDAVDEGAEAERGMARLGTAVKNTGGNFDLLRPAMEGAIDAVRRLSTYTDDDLRAALTGMVTLTGDTAGSMKNLALVADLAAARQIDLSTASDLVSKAMNGNVTGLNKLGFAGKDTTTVLENLRVSVGGFAETEAKTFGGALTNLGNGWKGFQEAVGTAILGTGEAGSTLGTLSGVLVDLEGFVVENADAIGQLTDALIWLVNGAIKVAVTAVRGWMFLLQSGKQIVGDFVATIGTMGEAMAPLLARFGFAITTNTATAMKKWGEQLSKSGKDGMDKLLGVTVAGETAVTATVEGHGQRRVQVTKDELAAREKAQKAHADFERKILEDLEAHWTRWAYNVKITTAKLPEALTAAAAQSLPPLKSVTAELDRVADASASMGNALGAATPKITKAGTEAKTAADKGAALRETMTDGARGAIGFASGLGLVGDEASNTANQVVTLGDAVGKLIGGGLSGAGLVGVITAATGALVSVLGSIFGGGGPSPEELKRRGIILDNTEAIRSNTDRIGDLLGLDISGGAYAGILDTITQMFGGHPYKVVSQEFLMNALSQKGVKWSDFQSLVKQSGLTLFDDKNQPISGAFGQFLTWLQNFEPTQFGQTWGDKLNVFNVKKSTGIITAGTEAQSFIDLVSGPKGSPLLASILGSADLTTQGGKDSIVQQFRDLIPQLEAGTINPAALGGLSGPEFLSAITTVIQLLTDDVADILKAPALSDITTPPGGPTIGPGPDLSVSIGSLADTGLQQVDYLGSIDAGIGSLTEAITRWTDIETGVPMRAVTVTVGDVYVTTSAPTSGETGQAVQQAIRDAIDEALAVSYRDAAQALGRVVRT